MSLQCSHRVFHQFRAGQIRVPLIRFEVFTGALFQLIVVAVQGIEALQKRDFIILKDLRVLLKKMIPDYALLKQSNP